MSRTIRLTKDIPNPGHDKRRSYGIRKVAVFKAGSLVHIVKDRDGIPRMNYEGHHYEYVDAALLKEMEANSEPTLPRTLGELLTQRAMSFQYAGLAIEHAIDVDGTVALGQMNLWLDRFEAYNPDGE